jgi:hypothetical protein
MGIDLLQAESLCFIVSTRERPMCISHGVETPRARDRRGMSLNFKLSAEFDDLSRRHAEKGG